MLTLFLFPAALAQEPGELQLRLTLLDAPFNFEGGYAVPSMAQSMDVTYNVNRHAMFGIHEGFGALFPENEGLRKGIGLAAAWSASIPLGFLGGWMHEEWHRAVMTSQGVSSRNGIYYPSAWSNGLIAVDNVSDDDLARLKAETPAYTVRLMSAGLESQHALAERVGDEVFFYGGEGEAWGPLYLGDSWMAPVIAMAELNNLFYHLTCLGEDSDALTDEENALRLTIPERDFTGLDCVAWAYDLSRPDEPYEARGAHPYGEGIDRYRSWSDLTAEEQELLTLQARLQLLNVLNPHLYGFNGFNLPGDGDRWIAQVGHGLTPFGYTVDGRFALKRGELNALVALHNYVSALGWSPGLDVSVLDRRLTDALSLDAGVDLWLQPAELRYDADARRPGGRLHGELGWRASQPIELWARVSAKTEGWVRGEVYLEPNVSGRAGLTVHMR